MKFVRRILAIFTLLAVAMKGVLSFLSWVERQEDDETLWVESEEFEEVI